MATTLKISQMEQLTEVANEDFIEVLDVSDTGMSPNGTNKKITVADFLAQLSALMLESAGD